MSQDILEYSETPAEEVAERYETLVIYEFCDGGRQGKGNVTVSSNTNPFTPDGVRAMRDYLSEDFNRLTEIVIINMIALTAD